MSITLGSNIASLQAQRQLFSTGQNLSTVFERLSSGQRINRAADDAAGLAIADSLNVDQRVYSQGVRNLNDGISFLNIADSSLDNLSGILTRLQELAEQSANGVYGYTQRQALDSEAQSLADEFLRIAQSTEFNGQKIFTGENPLVQLQAGYGDDAVIDASVGGAIGTGEFGSEELVEFGTNNGIAGVTGDFDGDGFLDLVKVNSTSGVVSVTYGQGDGTFQGDYATASLQSNAISDIEAGDFNGDGLLDLAVTGADGVSVALGDGAGGFGSGVSVTSSSQGQVKVGDFNNDGLEDLVGADSIRGTIELFFAQGDGTFSSGTTILDNGNGNLDDLDLADLNNDGSLDLVFSRRTNNNFQVLLGNGDASFQDSQQYAGGDNNAEDIALGDFNGDGFLDVVAADGADNLITVSFNNGDGTYGDAQPFAFASAGDLRSLEVADLNGDGLTDLVGTNYSDDTVIVALGSGDGTFGAYSTFNLDDTSRDIALGDFNSDGVTDVFSFTALDSTSQLVLGESTDGVSPLQSFSLGTIADARQALPMFQQRLELISEQRGIIGANQARIQVASNVLGASSENFAAAESRIRDADIALESSQLTRLNILQQAASAVLAQANQQPALAITLLR